jgi:hypothetical protein
MNNKVFALLAVTVAIMLLASCTGATVTRTVTQTQTTSQERTVTVTQTQIQDPVTRTVMVTTTVCPSDDEPGTATTTPVAPTETTTATTTPPPPATTTTTTTQAPVPTGYTTYTSSGLFSIAYPSDWELLNYLLEDLDGLVDDVLSSIDSGAPLDQASYIFFAGLPTQTDWIPSVNIVIESLPFAVSSLEEVVNAEVLGIQQFVDTYIEISREYVQIDGRQAAIIFWEGISGMNSFSNLQVFMFIDDLVWIITFTPPPDEFYPWEEDFYLIADSFRYLR